MKRTRLSKTRSNFYLNEGTISAFKKTAPDALKIKLLILQLELIKKTLFDGLASNEEETDTMVDGILIAKEIRARTILYRREIQKLRAKVEKFYKDNK